MAIDPTHIHMFSLLDHHRRMSLASTYRHRARGADPAYATPDPHVSTDRALPGQMQMHPHPPIAPTTVETSDDFDEMTIEGLQTTVYGEWAERHEVLYRQEQDHEDHERVQQWSQTQIQTPTEMHGQDPMQGHPWAAHSGLPPHQHTPLSPDMSAHHTNGEFGKYVREMEQVFGDDVQVTMKRMRSPIDTAVTTTSGGGGLSRDRNMGRVDGVRKIASSANMNSQRRKFGSDPKPSRLVESHVVEEGPGRTVTMWREEVARTASADMLTGGPHSRGFKDISSEVDSHVHRSQDRSPSMTADLNKLQRTQRRFPTDQSHPQPQSRRHFSGPSHGMREEQIYTPTDLGLPQFESPTGAKNHRRTPSPSRSERMYSMAELNALIFRAAQAGNKTPPRTRAQRAQSGTEPRTISSSSLGIHAGQFTSKTQPHASTGTGTGTGPQSRTSPPARSKDSSTKATSTTSVELILASCKPTLLHIAPVLAGLGIRQEEHLRAVARMSEETRNRELKDEVLKKGVTIMEWAILLDKLRTL